jgi:hypothetical protein
MHMQLSVVVYERCSLLFILEIPNPLSVNGQMKASKLKIDPRCPARPGAPRLERWGEFLGAW